MSAIVSVQDLGFSVASRLGPLYLGLMLASSLYGIVTLQIFLYAQSERKEPKSFRNLIYLVWLLDTAQVIILLECGYGYMIVNYGDPSALLTVSWSITGQYLIGMTTEFIIRLLFAQRVWVISNQNIYIVSAMMCTTLIHVGSILAYVIKLSRQSEFDSVSTLKWIFYIGAITECVCDGLIGMVMCVQMGKQHNGLNKLDSIISCFMTYIIDGCILTTLFPILTIITFSVWPTSFAFLALSFCVNKLLLNSLLSSLNAENAFEDGNQVRISDVPVTGLPRHWDAKELYDSRGGNATKK